MLDFKLFTFKLKSLLSIICDLIEKTKQLIWNRVFQLYYVKKYVFNFSFQIFYFFVWTYKLVQIWYI